jgi:3-oxoacyl-[acyl-carrier protein] reductase
MLTGRTALVMGGSRGIGAAIAERLSRDGADVALTFRDAAGRADDVVRRIQDAGRRGLAIRADSAEPEEVVAAVERAAAEFGRIDILVNNAGIYPVGPIDTVSPADVDRIFAIHVRAVVVATQAALRHMPADGRIITIGSNLAERVPYPGVALYAASKAALVGLTRGLARDLGPRGITVVVVHAGSTDTEMNPAVGPEVDAERALIALGRYNEPTDVALTVAHLAGEAGRNITGTTITIDGGFAA